MGAGSIPMTFPQPEATDPARLDYEDGLGIPLIRLLSDDLEFRETPGGTTVVMKFEPRLTTGTIEP